MKLIYFLSGILVWTTPLMAETYSWVDESGTYNFTEDYARVPKKYRGKLDRRGDMGATPQLKESVSPPTGTSAPTPPAPSKDSIAGKTQSPVGTFGGKSYDQWKQEFGQRESEMGTIRRRIDEIDALLKNNPPNREQAQALVAERNKAVEQFTEMRKQYDQFVEQARKAGIKVTITQ